MAYKQHASHKVQKVMVQPINLIFRHLQGRTRICVWLFESKLKIEGVIRGFDEFMNVVLDDAEEVYEKKGGVKRRQIGRILLKGDNVALIQPVLRGENPQIP